MYRKGCGCGFDFMLAYGTCLDGPREMRNISRHSVGVEWSRSLSECSFACERYCRSQLTGSSVLHLFRNKNVRRRLFQEPATVPSPEPEDSSSHPHSVYMIHFNIILLTGSRPKLSSYFTYLPFMLQGC